jgi:hypothetical protein
MYLYFFERVLRKASGDPDFALPYWDYTNDTVDAPDPATSARKIPSIFVAPTLQTSGGQIPNPLFESRRTAGFGSTVQLDPIDTNVDSTLLSTIFNRSRTPWRRQFTDSSIARWAAHAWAPTWASFRLQETNRFSGITTPISIAFGNAGPNETGGMLIPRPITTG